MLRIGVIGFGFIAQHGHAPFYRNDHSVQVVGIADCCEARLRAVSSCFPDARLFLSAQDMFHELEAQIDVIDICTPPYAHFELIVESVSRGYHVICEKPLMTDQDQIVQLIDLSRAQDRVIYPCHNYRFSPAARIVEELIAQDYIGVPQKATLHTYRKTHAKGVAEWKPDWRRNRNYSKGGILIDHGPHSIYIARRFLGNPRAVRVSCLAGKIRRDDYDTEDTVQLEVIYDHGQQSSMFLSWASAYRSTKYLIIGTSGYIELDNDIVKVTHDGNITVQDSGARFNDPSHCNWFGSMFGDFQERILNLGKQLDLAPLLEAFSVSAIICAGYMSARNEGQWMPVKDVDSLQVG